MVSTRAHSRADDPAIGVARRLSKLGVCSRSEAERRVAAGRVRVDGRVVLNPETPTRSRTRIELDDVPVAGMTRVYLMLNKPRGLVTTTQDERGRDTIYRCLDGHALPWVAPVGRLDKASEGLLLLSNDPEWAARLSDPAFAVQKTYHVQVDGHPDPRALSALVAGIEDAGELLRAESANPLRAGSRSSWIEIVLRQGRNRQIRRMLAQLGYSVQRLIRVGIGPLELGELGKGQFRALNSAELAALATIRP